MASRYASTAVWDFDLMRAANADAGRHFWSPATTRFFRARDGEVYQGPGGVFFSHSIRGPHDGGPRWYVVSQFNPVTMAVDSVKLPDGALSFSTFREAHKHARTLALGSPTPATGRAS